MTEKSSYPNSIHKKDTLIPGDSRIRNKAGEVGIFQGTRMVGDTEYLRVLFTDPKAQDEESKSIESLVPKQQLGKGKRFEVFTPEQEAEESIVAQQAKARNQAVQAQVDELKTHPLERKSALERPEDFGEDREKAEVLRDYIRANQTYSIDSLDYLRIPTDLKLQLAQLLREAKERDYLFRGDGRHPYGKGRFEESLKGSIQKLDASLGEAVSIPEIRGPFEDGFGHSDLRVEKYGWGYDSSHLEGSQYVSADLGWAVFFPEEDLLPKDWDKQAYLYFINPQAAMDKNYSSEVREDLEKMIRNPDEENEISLSAVDPKNIAYAISIDRKKKEVTGIFKNPIAQLDAD